MKVGPFEAEWTETTLFCCPTPSKIDVWCFWGGGVPREGGEGAGVQGAAVDAGTSPAAAEGWMPTGIPNTDVCAKTNT